MSQEGEWSSVNKNLSDTLNGPYNESELQAGDEASEVLYYNELKFGSGVVPVPVDTTVKLASCFLLSCNIFITSLPVWPKGRFKGIVHSK